MPEKKVAYNSDDEEILVSIGKGLYRVPELARPPEVNPRSGELTATLGRFGEIAELDVGTLHIAVGVRLKDSSSGQVTTAMNRSAKLAATCAIALGQAFGIQKIAEYTARLDRDETITPSSFFYSFRVPGPAVFDSEASIELARALTKVESSEKGTWIEAAITRYEASKRMSTEADRVLALWIAVERLANGVKSRIVRWFERVERLSCARIYEAHNHGSINFDFHRTMRDRIVHQGLTAVDPPWNGQGLLVSRAQLLDGYVGEGIRIALGMTPTGVVHRQLKIAADNPRASDQLIGLGSKINSDCHL